MFACKYWQTPGHAPPSHTCKRGLGVLLTGHNAVCAAANQQQTQDSAWQCTHRSTPSAAAAAAAAAAAHVLDSTHNIIKLV
jgi:hypothetical protein